MTSTYYNGQKWISTSEPELGLGTIMGSKGRDVIIIFSASGENRRYRIANAPLKRVIYKPGDIIRDNSGGKLVISEVKVDGNYLIYLCGQVSIHEQDLNADQTFGNPYDRLQSGSGCSVKDFDLRLDTHIYRHRALSKEGRGFFGPRAELMPHQISIAMEACARSRLRILLADEVGLGKTIEAGFIFHHLWVTGKIKRVLIITPEPLVHQWLLEMYRRFNHMFTIMNDDYYDSQIKTDENRNPFLFAQTFICSLGFLINSSQNLQQAVEAQWDMIIVDEAHHLRFYNGNPSPEYLSVEKLVHGVPYLLLLTATPVQLGEEGHFGRLRLLDPQRYTNYADFIRESKGYGLVARIASSILSGAPTPGRHAQDLKRLFPGDEQLLNTAALYAENPDQYQDTLIQQLVDRHGTGRNIFRNRRSLLKHFPKRHLFPTPCQPSQNYNDFWGLLMKHLDIQSVYFQDPLQLTPSNLKLPVTESIQLLKDLWINDPRLLWLVEFLKNSPKEDKVLVICDKPGKVLLLQDLLPRLLQTTFTVFHEKMTLSIRDKNAADFSKPDGARILICSELGTEGRNFQFAHKLVLFDLPLNPNTLEQRIGRLQRIGQKQDVQIFVPYVTNTPGHILFQWFHEGLDAFAAPILGSESIYDACKEDIQTLIRENMPATISTPFPKKAVTALLKKTRAHTKEVQKTIENARDRLLEINTVQTLNAQRVINSIESEDELGDIEDYMQSVLESYGVDFRNTAESHGYIIFPGPEMTLDAFPELPENGLAVTFNREQALIREDLNFLTWEHPLVTGAMDLVHSTAENTSCAAEWPKCPQPGLYLEVIYILEASGSLSGLTANYLPPTPIRIVLDTHNKLRDDLLDLLQHLRLKQAPSHAMEQFQSTFGPHLQDYIQATAPFAEKKADVIKKQYLEQAYQRLNGDYQRLVSLKQLNPAVSDIEVKEMKKRRDSILKYLSRAVIRLDATRIIFGT